ncbi:MAG TPA: hypothetical protein VGU46_07195 [Acidobacteriaceae bacterium]|nr:hypothetical protein [Acidobacteriaceae bacterium]
MAINEYGITPWSAGDSIQIKGSAPSQIIEHAGNQLSTRDMRAIVDAFSTENYEMAATFIWTKAAAVLKRQVASLGMEFVGEMLGRPDLTEESDPARSLSDHEAISLAEDLSMINATQALRLSHALELVGHFTRMERHEAEDESMSSEEAVSLLKSCVVSILSRPNFEGADSFRTFRQQLSSTTLKSSDFNSLLESPYFFVRTTLSILLALIKTEKGAPQEHAIGNITVALTIVWSKLRDKEKWQVGQAYAEVNSEGNKAASTGLRAALIKVHGFDFVPESLRSNSFTEAAARILEAHYGWNNFYTEAQPTATLASMGTAIPKPAFAKCMEAVLAVSLGNEYGRSFAGAEAAMNILKSLRAEQWDYYLNECLITDKTVLDKLAWNTNPGRYWLSLCSSFELAGKTVKDKQVRRLLDAGATQNLESLQKAAKTLRERILK